MAESGVDIDLYIDHVEVAVKEATDEVLKQLAYRIVELAQVNIRLNDQIDTGFMVNSVYPIWQDGSGHGAAETAARAMADREVIEEQLEAGASAAVVVGANYAIYQEAANPFLYRAADEAAIQFGAEAERIYKEKLPDEGPRV
jgi:hypothetical protein